tara:strand:+ start:83 stop:442 length:360 start_codon:yes stop_codon:yes gene_type:complete
MEIKYFPLIDEDTLLKTLEKIQPILLIILQNPKWVYGSIKKATFERESTEQVSFIWILLKNKSYQLEVTRVERFNEVRDCLWIFNTNPIVTKVHVRFHTGTRIIFNYSTSINIDNTSSN